MKWLKSLFSKKKIKVKNNINPTKNFIEDMKFIKEAGSDNGDHYTDSVEIIKQLKRDKKYDEAIEILLKSVDLTENESSRANSTPILDEKYAFLSAGRTNSCGVAPWYYEQLAIIYRKQEKYSEEVAILERYSEQPKAPGVSPQKLAERLVKARELFCKGEISNNYSSNDIDVITSIGQRLVEVINESLTIANNSTNPETKVSRFAVAKDKLSELKELSEQYSFITITSLSEVESCISELENEFIIAGYEETVNGNTLGKFLEKEGKNKEAIVEYEKLALKKVSTPFTYRRLAILYRKFKDKNNEIRVIQEAIHNIPKSNSKDCSWFQNRLEKIKNA